MASVIYRLLNMTNFRSGSTDEAIRPGVLAFSSSVSMQWKQLEMSCDQLAATYRLSEFRCSHVHPQLPVWLLMVGAVSIPGEADDADEMWLRP